MVTKFKQMSTGAAIIVALVALCFINIRCQSGKNNTTMQTIEVNRVDNLEKMSINELKKSLTNKGSIGEIDIVNWKEYPYKPRVTFRIAHSLTHLFVMFDVKEDNVKAVTTENNGPVWEDSCVEFFVRQPESPYYYNFETNCIGAGLAAKRVSKTEATHFTDKELDRVRRISSLPFEQTDRHIKDDHWTLILGMPLELIGVKSEFPQTLQANFYKCGDKTETPHFLSWSPIDSETPNFHLPEFFGELILK